MNKYSMFLFIFLFIAVQCVIQYSVGSVDFIVFLHAC